ncbi:MAG: toll/interleukin-1 receptor domain-containing protein [Selenomonadaceae bacterium]|nr:toll/interleukin-1 receptor domain-containing protein [Selenomonadaceae bacterium]
MQNDCIPKVFISYSWSSDQIVLELAQRLMSHGIDVVLDKWDLKEGQDKYAFMERCVNDPDVTKVLIVCDKQYAQKANARTGGVGDETVIISGEVYGKMKQEKFVPIIAEKDENGEPYVPTYIGTRIYIDLSDEATYEQAYEKLLRNIYDKPSITKPKLGKKPEWLDEEKRDFFLLRDIIKQTKNASTNAKRRSCINRFSDEFLDILKGYYIKNVDGKGLFDDFLSTKQVRDFFLDFVEALAEISDDYAECLADIFEKLYNTLTCIKTFEPKVATTYGENVEIFKILIWELFVYVIAFMRHNEDYKSINTMITRTYFLDISIFGGNLQPTNYTVFRHYSRLIEEGYKPTTEFKNYHTLIGNIVYNQREKLPIYSKSNIAEADLFLYQVCNAFELAQNENNWHSALWFPTLYVYAGNATMEWKKMKSKRYCNKMFDLFGVSTIDELKVILKKCTYNNKIRYSGAYEAALAIENYIKIDEIGCLN